MDMSNNEDTASIAKLPNEILLDIFSYLEGHELLNCLSVCKTWKVVASDGFLWQRKLCELFGKRWSTIVCEKKPSKHPDLFDLDAIHACRIYTFLYNYVPRHLKSNGDGSISTYDHISTFEQNHPASLQSVGRMLKRCWSQMLSRITAGVTRRNARRNPPPFRFAVLGPGFDQRATSRLFSKLVDVRTRSFEPVSLIPGRMGFGAGLTLRLHAQAQIAVLDPSIRKCSVHSRGSPHMIGRHETRNGQTQLQASHSGTTQTLNETPNGEDAPVTEDFIFDLHYLYSLRGNLTSKFTNQMERILQSRFFDHPTSEELSNDAQILSSLTVTESMHNILKGINGMIYALDARESVEQTRVLFYELHGILRSLPERIAKLLPIVILYIMPKEDILLRPTTSPNSSHQTIDMLPQNRDSYSGVEYTISWLGSLLLPISCLQLFELENPWRLQKCASNDIKAVIQSIMWLRERAPTIPLEQLHQLTSNSTW